MTNRVLIQGGATAAMIVSLPGYDVASVDVDHTVFDSRYSGMQPYRQGVTIDSVNDNSSVYAFGETLNGPPLMFGFFRTLTPGGVPDQVYGNTCKMLRGGGTDEWFYAEVTTSSLTWRVKFGGQAARLYFSLFKRVAG